MWRIYLTFVDKVAAFTDCFLDSIFLVCYFSYVIKIFNVSRVSSKSIRGGNDEGLTVYFNYT